MYINIKKIAFPVLFFSGLLCFFPSNYAFAGSSFQRPSLLSAPAKDEIKADSAVRAARSLAADKNKKKVTKAKTKKKYVKKKVKTKGDSVLVRSELPKKYSGWNLSISDVEKSLPERCELRSDVFTMFDGVGDTSVELHIDSERITLLTDSSIDNIFNGTGLRLPDDSVLAFDHVEQDTNVVFDFSYDLVNKYIKKHKKIQVDIAFWPLSKKNEKHSIEIDASELEQAFKGLAECEKIVSKKV